MESYSFMKLCGSELDLFNPNLKIFEQVMKQPYSLGSDSFTIDHGSNYFNFFKRLGEVNYFIIQSEKTKLIAGTGCAILRNYKGKKFWYLCDLKVEKEHRGNNLTMKLFINFIYDFILVSNSGYLISMDPGSKQIVNIFTKVTNLPTSIITSIIKINTDVKLLIYSVSRQMMTKIEPMLEKFFGDLSYLSLEGKKDLIMQSYAKRMNLYHLQHGPYKANLEEIKLLTELASDVTIMFCLTSTNPLVDLLEKMNITTDISATVISHQMDFFNWDWILTSDI